jgi:hypothetical protein
MGKLLSKFAFKSNWRRYIQAQVFTVVNDENYYYPDLIRGMVVDGVKGLDVAKYTGSTTGESRSNTVCSKVGPAGHTYTCRLQINPLRY